MSNVVVIMLSLVLIVMIVGNVVLWSYDMNQLDWEKMQEKMTLTDAQRGTTSPWFVSKTEYTTEAGTRIGGSFIQTQTQDDNFETFAENLTETTNTPRLSFLNDIGIDITKYPLHDITALHIRVRYNVTSNIEKWFLSAYNWTSSGYSDIGFNTTSGNQPSPNIWNEYTVSLTDSWTSYVASNGTMRVRFSDEGTSLNETTVEIDFFGVDLYAKGLEIYVRNSSPLTAHVVAVWAVNETSHERFETNLYINSGEQSSLTIVTDDLPEGNLSLKVVTERGNMAVFP
jgi:hypothetical protein